jgi:tetratricopeptide (TPR) repeat protein
MIHQWFRVFLVVLAGIVAAASAPSGLCGASQGDAARASADERLIRVRGDLLSGAAHIDEDIQELKALLALDPRSAEAHMLLGIAYRSRGSAELVGEAVAELRQAVALNPGFAAARFYLARTYLDLGRAARAREELEAALAQSPGNPQFLALLGETERQLKNPGRSVDLTRQALQADGSSAEARYYLALALHDLGHRDEAIKELARVVQSGPNVGDAYLNLGIAYLEAGQLDEAVAILIQGTRVDPSRPDLRTQLARAYRSKGSLAKADEQLALAMPHAAASVASPFARDQEQQLDFYMEQGFIRLQQGRLEAAATAFQKALAIDPNHGPTTRSLAEVYLRQGLYPRASEYAARAEKLGFPLPEDKRTLLQQKLRSRNTGDRE